VLRASSAHGTGAIHANGHKPAGGNAKNRRRLPAMPSPSVWLRKGFGTLDVVGIGDVGTGDVVIARGAF
jgi:hypothetical protein